jgi:hypothetical protein
VTRLGARPLVVVTATVDEQDGWLAAQDGLVSLSTNGVHRVIAGVTHEGLIMTDTGVTASSTAILDVVTAIRTGGALAS